jgi:hypothetical protein
MTERTNLWDALGVGSYGLMRAFIETVIIFIIFAGLGMLTPIRWGIDKRISFMGLLVFMLSAWGMIGQLLFIWNINLPPSVVDDLARSGHPLRILYGASLAVVVPTLVLPGYFFLRFEKVRRLFQDFAERLSLLTMFYLFLDLAGLMIVAIRNVR